MTGGPPPVTHLSDTEIDDYWSGALTHEEEERIEQHYLDCNECAERVRAVEEVLNLRHQPAKAVGNGAPRRRYALALATAIFLLAAGGIGGYRWAQTTRSQTETAGPRPPGEVMVTALAPPTRDSQLVEVTLPSSGIAVFDLDAREAAPGGTSFDLSLATGDGRVVLRMAGVRSSSTGVVRIPIDRAALDAGRYQFELTAGPAVVGYPFLIR